MKVQIWVIVVLAVIGGVFTYVFTRESPCVRLDAYEQKQTEDYAKFGIDLTDPFTALRINPDPAPYKLRYACWKEMQRYRN